MDWEKWVKLLPADKVYEDLFQPSMQEGGQAIKNVVKTARFVLAPFDYLAAWQDRFQRYIKRIAGKTESAELVPAPPEITGKSFEGMRYLSEDNPLTEMFINLLATALENDNTHLAHPSFPGILTNLCRDEALMLYYSKTVDHFTHFGFTFESRLRHFHHPRNIPIYTEHMVSLGLFHMDRKRIRTDTPFGGDLDEFNSRREYHLSEMGKMFIAACIRDDINLIYFGFDAVSEDDSDMLSI